MLGRPGFAHKINRNASYIQVAALLSLAVWLGSATAVAQVLYGTLLGTVTDQSGAVVPGVTVTITNQSTGAIRTVTADGQGNYALRDVLPDTYQVSVQAPGFSNFTQKNIQVNVNREVRVDIALQVGTVAQQVTVNTAPPELQTDTAEVSHQITETQLTQLPVTSSQGRQFQSLYTIVPGATAVAEQNSTASNPSRAMSANFNGINSMGNTTRIDGAINYYGWLPYLIAYVPPADSIQNVNISTDAFNAEQGVAGGASVNITTKSGTRDLHGSAWEYYQDAAFNARAYTATRQASPTVPKNIFNEFGFNVGGPVYIPKILTGRSKLFFFQNFERTTRRQLISGLQSVPDANMIAGNFSETVGIPNGLLYDPQPGGAGPYLAPAARPTFLSEYGCNCVPTSRQSSAAATMIALLAPIAKTITPTPALLNSGLLNDYFGTGTLAYNRTTSDTKINYLLNPNTQLFGKYSIEPFNVDDPQTLGQAGGGTFDGGQPGAASGRIQNVGLGFSHVFSANKVVDADFGYTRQITGAQSTIDLSVGDYGLNVLGIPGTNGPGKNYVGQPYFAFGTQSSNGTTNSFSSLGNANGANPFQFRDNQFTGDVNFSWTLSRHATKYGFTYYHFLLNHFQPTSGSFINNPRGGFAFQGGMTCGAGCGITTYNTLADFLLGLPNESGAGPAVAKAVQQSNPNALRWTEWAGYAQDQWTVTPSLTVNYGVRYEYYPPPYRDHSGVYILDPTLPQSGNVEIGGVGPNPHDAGLDMGYGFFAPRLGIAYRINERTVVRAGGGITSDPDSLRFLRDTFPEDVAPNYTSPSVGSIAVDPANGNAPMTLSYGIPPTIFPPIVNGFASLPVTGSTVTARKDYRRGYIESWNLFFQRDLGAQISANLGYVGNHFVRQLTQTGYLNAAPLPSGDTVCMANGQFNPSSPYVTGPLGSNPCAFQANETANIGAPCPAGTKASALGTCYNTGGIGMVEPLFSSNYNGLQAQLTRNAGKNSSFGLVYTWSHAFAYEENGAGSGSAGLAFNYPAYYSHDYGTATYDRTNNIQFWGIYTLPFGHGQKWATHGIADAILGGFQLNGQFSHISGIPFTVSANSNTVNAPGNPLYANLVKPYRQIGGRNRVAGSSAVSGGNVWFDPSAFANPAEPTYSPTQDPSTIQSPTFGNTGRDQFRGPGQSVINASLFRGFHVWRETEFQIRFEAFNVLNHALLGNPNTTVPSNANLAAGNYGTFGMITGGYGNSRSLQFSGRFNF
jgi:Carboxypeptidase regulatory-like domain